MVMSPVALEGGRWCGGRGGVDFKSRSEAAGATHGLHRGSFPARAPGDFWKPTSSTPPCTSNFASVTPATVNTRAVPSSRPIPSCALRWMGVKVTVGLGSFLLFVRGGCCYCCCCCCSRCRRWRCWWCFNVLLIPFRRQTHGRNGERPSVQGCVRHPGCAVSAAAADHHHTGRET